MQSSSGTCWSLRLILDLVTATCLMLWLLLEGATVSYHVPQDYNRASDEKQIDLTLLHLVIWLPYKKNTDWKDSSKWSWRFSVWISFNRPLDCANRKWQLCSQDHNGKNPEAFEEFPCFFAFESQLCCCCWLSELNFFSLSEAMAECNLGHQTVTTFLCKLVTDKRWT